jgi:undecaprenyl-diphosphatase
VTVLWRSRTPLVLAAVAAVGSLAMTAVGKDFVGRARPPQTLAVPPFETSPSFPSGHTLNATVLVGVVVYLLLRRQDTLRARVGTVVAGGVFVVAMGLSRVFLGHHWLSDVVMGWVLGLAWLCAVVTAHRLYLTVRRARGEAASPQADASGRSTTQWSPSSRNPRRW